MTLTTGSKLSHYTILGPLGAGAMGEVYRAKDSKLGREVAIKVLPEHFADDEERLKRFEREAKTLASLNHPNVAQIFGVDQVGDMCFLVLELVPGETLEERLKRGPLPIDEALDVAKQIAEGLEAAHEAGVIHRDLKPANVRITPDGKVKVLDFGLAKPANEMHPGSSTDSVLSTEAGRLLGTPTYMAPEQARGKSIDRRVDIWAFGCVLYECLTAKRAFAGETLTDVFASVIEREPDWTSLPSDVSPRIRDLLATCLAKDRRNRLHDIGDARLEIERALSGRDSSLAGDALSSRGRVRGRHYAAVVAGAIVLVGATWFVTSRMTVPNAPPANATRLLIASRSSTYAGAGGAVISPDGKSVVFVAWSIDRSKACLWIRSLDSFEARPLAETDGAFNPFWSHDGRSVAFSADDKLWAVDVAQGSARRLIAADHDYGGVDWGPDGSILFARTGANSEILRIPPGGGPAESLTTLDPASLEKAHVFPRFLPDGEHYLYVGVVFDPASEIRQGRLYVGRVGSKEQTFVANIISRVWYVEPGWLVYVDDGTVKAALFDTHTLKITGEAVTIADDVSYFRDFGASSLSVSRDGTLTYQPPDADQQLVWFDLTGKRLGTVGPRCQMNHPRFSPDGAQVALDVFDRRTGYSDLWLFGTARSTTTHLTTDARDESNAVWSRDASRIYYAAGRATTPEVVSIRTDGSGTVESVYGLGVEGLGWYPQDISPDGKSLLVRGNVDKRGIELRVVNLDRKSAAVPFRSTPASEYQARFSPDGKWVAFVSDESGTQEVYLSSYPERGAKVQVSEGGGWKPLWSPEGNRIYYARLNDDGMKEAALTTSAMLVVDLDSAEAFNAPPKPRVLFERPEVIDLSDITPDGKRFLSVCESRESQPIHVVLDAIPKKH